MNILLLDGGKEFGHSHGRHCRNTHDHGQQKPHRNHTRQGGAHRVRRRRLAALQLLCRRG